MVNQSTGHLMGDWKFFLYSLHWGLYLFKIHKTTYELNASMDLLIMMVKLRHLEMENLERSQRTKEKSYVCYKTKNYLLSVKTRARKYCRESNFPYGSFFYFPALLKLLLFNKLSFSMWAGCPIDFLRQTYAIFHRLFNPGTLPWSFS